MSRRTIILSAFLLLLIFSISGSTDVQQIRIQAGISIYPDPRAVPLVYVEFPFALNRCDFQFIEEDSTGPSYIAGVYAELILLDTLGNPVDSSSTYFLTRARDSADALKSDIRLFNRLTMTVKPGIYSARLMILDAVSKTEGNFIYDRLEISPSAGGKMLLSTLELAHDIEIVDENPSSEAQMRLVKNGRKVIPNPMGIYSDGDSSLFIYAELYNLAYGMDINDTISLNYKVYGDDGSLYYDYGDITQQKPGSSCVISHALNIADYIPGRYGLKLIARDFASGDLDSSFIKFIIFPRTGGLPQVVSQRILHPYDSASLKTKTQLSRFLLSPTQSQMLATLNDVGKERFIDQFFTDKDPDLKTQENEFLDDVFRRYIFANENYSTLPGFNDGWNTDRGRVLLQYGPWDTRTEESSPAYGKPWEKWTYYSIQGGVIFVFQDIAGYGDFELVHSTADGEIYNAEWDKVIKENAPLFTE